MSIFLKGRKRKIYIYTSNFSYYRHYRKAAGALLFYDLTDEKSYESTQDWLKEIE
jgi:hypothetical protein